MIFVCLFVFAMCCHHCLFPYNDNICDVIVVRISLVVRIHSFHLGNPGSSPCMVTNI